MIVSRDNMYYLYKITNIFNDKVYIGQTINAYKRWLGHKSSSKSPQKTGQYIHYAMSKYGINNFTFEVISSCKIQEDTNEAENILIQQYNSRDKQFGYNLKSGGHFSSHSESSKIKISNSLLGNKRGIGNKNHLGHKHSNDVRVKMSNSLKGRIAPNKGKPGFCGEDNPRSKVTEKIVLEIREKYASSNYTQIELVKEYNVSTSIICRIINRKSWKHI